MGIGKNRISLVIGGCLYQPEFSNLRVQYTTLHCSILFVCNGDHNCLMEREPKLWWRDNCLMEREPKLTIAWWKENLSSGDETIAWWKENLSSGDETIAWWKENLSSGHNPTKLCFLLTAKQQQQQQWEK